MNRKTRRIALVLDLDWPYKRHSGVYAGTQKYIDEQGWEAVIDEYAHDSLPTEPGDPMPYDGIIARASSTLAQRCLQLDVPLVNVWSSSPSRDELPCVLADYHAAGRMRADHLISRGLRSFAALGCRGDTADQLEMESFLEMLRSLGHKCEVAWIPLAYSKTLAQWQRCQKAIGDWMDKWSLPIGVFVGGDNLGRLVVQKCRERGWRVPEDVAIIAGRNEETLCVRPRPSITSLEFGYDRIGYEAAKVLHRLMDKKNTPSEPLYLPPVGLVVRESTDFLVVEDELVSAALSFIAMNCHGRIGQDDVARALSVETRTLQNRFRKVLDQPVAATIRKVRLERAKRELVQTDRSLKIIARDAGFGSPMRMYELFKRELGVTPTEFRKQRRL